VLLCIALIEMSCAQPGAQERPDDFRVFWTAFRNAILEGKREQVAAMTHFPFRTRGSLDSDPVRTHDRQSFFRLFDRLLEQDPGLSRETSTMRKLIYEKTMIADRELSGQGTQMRVGTFTFRKVNAQWLFALAYLDE
jgi:hypothetical protein